MCTDITLLIGRNSVKYNDAEYMSTHSGSVFRLKKVKFKKDKSGKVSNEKAWVEYEIYIEDPKDFYTLSHEIIHLVKHLFQDRQIPFDVGNDEMIAYYHTFLLKKLWKKIHYSKKGKK